MSRTLDAADDPANDPGKYDHNKNKHDDSDYDDELDSDFDIEDYTQLQSPDKKEGDASGEGDSEGEERKLLSGEEEGQGPRKTRILISEESVK